MAEDTTAAADTPASELPDAHDTNAETATAVADAPAESGKLNQTVEINDIGPCKKHVKVTVNREVIDGRFKEKFDELLKDGSAQVPGFRPGKAPRKFIERRFKVVVKEDVRREVLMASLQQLAEDNTLSPLAPPDLKPDQLVLPDEGPFIYEFDVEVRPEFDLPEYKGIKLRKPVRHFTDADIAAEQRRLLEEHGTLVPKGGADATIEMNDIVVVDLSTFDGAREVSRATEVRIRVEKKLALTDGVAENFGKRMVGAKAGETREIGITLAESVADQALRGKTVMGKFLIKEVKTIRPPDLTPDLFEKYGVKNAGQLQELIATTLERNLEYTQRQYARQQVLQLVTATVKWDLPRDLIVRQATRILERRVVEMRSAGMTETQIESRMKVLRQNTLQNTTIALMEHFVLQKIAEVEKIEIEDEDIDAEIARIASQANESFRKVKAQMERNNQVEALATDLMERKALDVVLNNAVYEEYELKPEEDEGEVATANAQAVPGEMIHATESVENKDQ